MFRSTVAALAAVAILALSSAPALASTSVESEPQRLEAAPRWVAWFFGLLPLPSAGTEGAADLAQGNLQCGIDPNGLQGDLQGGIDPDG